jgi:perosamine synthetase
MDGRTTDGGRPIALHRPSVGPAELAAVAEVFETRWLGMGEATSRFEERLRERLGVPHVLGVATGTAALHLALEAIGAPPGHEAIVPSLTFVATVQAVVAAGLRPVFCEVRADTLTLDVEDAERLVTPRTAAIVPVHYGGVSCDMPGLIDLARRRGVRLVEDAAHAFGSADEGWPVGTRGDIGCFSFDPIKNITCGEGGAVATRDETLALRVRRRRNLGIDRDGWARQRSGGGDYEVSGPGYRYHMSNVNAAIGLAQLERADEFRARRQAVVRAYDAALAGLDGLAPVTRPAAAVFPFTYVVRVAGGRRDALLSHLRARGIGAAIEYIPNHLQPAFAAFRRPMPVTERLFAEILSLPLHAELTAGEVARVVEEVHAFFAPPSAGGAPAPDPGQEVPPR